MNEASTGAKLSVALLGGSLATWMGGVWPMLALVFVFLVMDYATGMMAAGLSQTLSSKRGAAGIVKKVATLALLLLGLILDVAIPFFAARGFDINLGVRLPFGLIICAWIIINEAISILENLYSCGVKVPGFLLKMLKIKAEELEKGGGA